MLPLVSSPLFPDKKKCTCSVGSVEELTAALGRRTEPVGLTQLSAQMRAQWVLKAWQVARVPRPVVAWSRWLVDVRWRERLVRAGNRLACGGLGVECQHMLVLSKTGHSDIYIMDKFKKFMWINIIMIHQS